MRSQWEYIFSFSCIFHVVALVFRYICHFIQWRIAPLSNRMNWHETEETNANIAPIHRITVVNEITSHSIKLLRLLWYCSFFHISFLDPFNHRSRLFSFFISTKNTSFRTWWNVTSISKMSKSSTCILSIIIVNNFHALEVVDRVSETQFQVGENSN